MTQSNINMRESGQCNLCLDEKLKGSAITLWKFVAENDTEKSQLLWNSILQKEMLHWKFFSAI